MFSPIDDPSYGGGGDIWSTGVFAFESPLKDLLDANDYTLDDLLEQDEQMSGVCQALLHLVQTRARHAEFHPQAPQAIERLHPGVVAVRRGDILAISSVSEKALSLPLAGRDLLSGQVFQDQLELEPYGVVWLSPD